MGSTQNLGLTLPAAGTDNWTAAINENWTELDTAIAGLRASVEAVTTPVASVFGRTGAVTAQTNDYTFSQIGGTIAVGQLPPIPAADITGVLGIANGGTNATIPVDARENIGAAASGVNSDITELTGLTTPLSLAQGGTGGSTLQEVAALLAGQFLTPTGSNVVDGTFQFIIGPNMDTGLPATSSASQPSSALNWTASYWNGAASTASTWSAIASISAAGNNPPVKLSFSQAGSTGVATVEVPALQLANSTGVTIPDTTNGHVYQLTVTNGAIVLTEIS
jgi:hypothetical protein